MKPDTAPSVDREAGFTLVELLVSLAILSLCATLLLGGLASASIVARQTRSAERANAEVAAAQILLRARIEAMRPVRRLDAGEPEIDANGGQRVFDFVGPPQDSESGSGLRLYRLTLTAPGDLILYQSPELASGVERAAPSLQGWRPTTLLQGAASLAIGYFGVTKADPARRWRTNWGQNSAMPDAIRIRVGFPEGDRRVWPELVVRPASTLDLRCDPESSSNSQTCPGEAS
jgi:general secretion pathway protein J